MEDEEAKHWVSKHRRSTDATNIGKPGIEVMCNVGPLAHVQQSEIVTTCEELGELRRFALLLPAPY